MVCSVRVSLVCIVYEQGSFDMAQSWFMSSSQLVCPITRYIAQVIDRQPLARVQLSLEVSKSCVLYKQGFFNPSAVSQVSEWFCVPHE
jgi:hypothetical protein